MRYIGAISSNQFFQRSTLSYSSVTTNDICRHWSQYKDHILYNLLDTTIAQFHDFIYAYLHISPHKSYIWQVFSSHSRSVSMFNLTHKSFALHKW